MVPPDGTQGTEPGKEVLEMSKVPWTVHLAAGH